MGVKVPIQKKRKLRGGNSKCLIYKFSLTLKIVWFWIKLYFSPNKAVFPLNVWEKEISTCFDWRIWVQTKISRPVRANLCGRLLQIKHCALLDWQYAVLPFPSLVCCFFASCPIFHSAACTLPNLLHATCKGCSCHLGYACHRLATPALDCHP